MLHDHVLYVHCGAWDLGVMMKKQTTVYVCDRCGKEYMHIQQVRDFSFTSFDNMESEDSEQYGRLTYDLCDECVNGFKHWWNRGAGNVWFPDTPRTPHDEPVIPVPDTLIPKDAGTAALMSVESFIREQENRERKLKALDEMTMQEKHEDIFGY